MATIASVLARSEELRFLPKGRRASRGGGRGCRSRARESIADPYMSRPGGCASRPYLWGVHLLSVRNFNPTICPERSLERSSTYGRKMMCCFGACPSTGSRRQELRHASAFKTCPWAGTLAGRNWRHWLQMVALVKATCRPTELRSGHLRLYTMQPRLVADARSESWRSTTMSTAIVRRSMPSTSKGAAGAQRASQRDGKHGARRRVGAEHRPPHQCRRKCADATWATD